MSPSGKLAGKVALVTGASANIGGALAGGLAAAGARVACNDIRAEVAEACAARIVAAGGEAVALPFDVTDADAAARAIDEMLSHWGRIDILINNAVRFDRAGLLDMTPDRLRAQLDVMLTGTFTMTQLVARSMIERGIGGSIVNLLSGAAWQGAAGNIGYATGKSGLINFTRAAAMDLAPHGIRVNGLTPTVTAPEDPEKAATWSQGLDGFEGGRFEFGRLFPWPRFPTPADYVAPLVFLASDEAAMITGTNLTVDGGALAKYWPEIPARPGGE